jgi:hypothetical protein
MTQPDQTQAERPAQLGGYYWNSLVAWQRELKADLRIGRRRLATLEKIGSSCLEDHRAAMAVRGRMLIVVQDALSERPKEFS